MHNSTRSSGRANPSALLIDFPRSNRSQNATSNSSGLNFDSDENTDQNLDDSSGGRHQANDIQNNIQIDELDDVILPKTLDELKAEARQAVLSSARNSLINKGISILKSQGVDLDYDSLEITNLGLEEHEFRSLIELYIKNPSEEVKSKDSKSVNLTSDICLTLREQRRFLPTY
jgi:hypothetical protein